MKPTLSRSLLLVCLGLALASSAVAQQDKKASREREALRRAQQQVQKANQDLAALQEKMTAIEQERGQLASEVESSKARASSEAARGRKLEQDLKALQAERDKLVSVRAEQDTQLKERAERVAKLERDLAQAIERGKQLDTQSAAQLRQTEACEVRSGQLYKAGRELLDECRVLSTVNLETISGSARTQVENRLELHRDRLEEARSGGAVSTAVK